MKGSSSVLLFTAMIRVASSFLGRRACHGVKRRNQSSLASTVTPEPTSIEFFNPIGPPTRLADLAIGETCTQASSAITRLSQSPDLFLIKDFVSQADREILMQAAADQGMKTAGTRSSEANTIRKNSYLTWIDPYDLSGSTSVEALSVARDTIHKSGALFAHEAMHKMILEGGRVDYFFAEDLQVAKYDTDGCFNFHHDGYSRYLTVLIYLNGVGGTWFPRVNFQCEFQDIDIADDEASAVEIARSKVAGQDGLLFVGEEGLEPYIQSLEMKPGSVVQIEAGDAVAFYSYKSSGQKDWKSLHCSLPVPQEKWIATSWFRSEALTGPFSYLKKEAMLDQS